MPGVKKKELKTMHSHKKRSRVLPFECLRIREAHQEASRDKANSKFQKFKF
jgi:hypothetical protein